MFCSVISIVFLHYSSAQVSDFFLYGIVRLYFIFCCLDELPHCSLVCKIEHAIQVDPEKSEQTFEL